MRIINIKSQNRRDFHATYECEHCGHIEDGSGYDDANFHRNVIPKMKCKRCGKIASGDYQPRSTKYPAHMII